MALNINTNPTLNISSPTPTNQPLAGYSLGTGQITVPGKPTKNIPGALTGQSSTTVPNMMTGTTLVPVNKTPDASKVNSTNAITLPQNIDNTQNSLRATTDAAMSTPPSPPQYYDMQTGFLTNAGKAAGQKPIQPNDPAGGSNSNLNSYLDSSNPSSINNGNIIPDNSGNKNNTLLSQYQGLNSQLGTENDVRTGLNSQFGVDQKQQNYIDAFNNYQSKSVAYNQQVESLYNQPGVTREQATQQVSEIQRENNADLANLAVITQAAQGNYTTALDIVQRKMDAQFQPVQAQIDNLKSIVQSPNSDLTASQTAQINANVFALQNNLTNTKNALSTGSQTLIQNGLYTSDIGKALDAAQTPEQVNSIVSQAMTGAGLSYSPNGTSGSAGLSNVSPQYQSYVAQTSSGASYVPQTKLTNLTAFQQQEAARQLAAAGIPVLDADQTLKIQNIDVTQQNLAGLQNVIDGVDVTTGKQGAPLLGSGVTGRIGSSITNTLGAITQSNPNIAAFNNYRLTAINTLQSLGAGSGGSRITASEIATAVSNLPTLTDNMETGKAKLSIVNGFLTKWTNELLPNQKNSSNSGASGSGLYDW